MIALLLMIVISPPPVAEPVFGLDVDSSKEIVWGLIGVGSASSLLIPSKSPKKEKNPAWAGWEIKNRAISIAIVKNIDFLLQNMVKISLKYGNCCFFQPFQPVFLILRPWQSESRSYPQGLRL